MEFEKLKRVIAEVLNVDPDDFRLSWESKKNLILRSRLKKQKKSLR